MTGVFQLLLPVLCSVALTAVTASCKGAGYDLSSLQDKTLFGSYNGLDYYLTICGLNKHTTECQNQQASICAYQAPNTYIMNFGKWLPDSDPAPKWDPLDDGGVRVIFKNADVRVLTIPTTYLYVHCSPGVSTNSTMVVTEDNYVLHAHMWDKAACDRDDTFIQELTSATSLAILFAVLIVVSAFFFCTSKYYGWWKCFPSGCPCTNVEVPYVEQQHDELGNEMQWRGPQNEDNEGIFDADNDGDAKA